MEESPQILLTPNRIESREEEGPRGGTTHTQTHTLIDTHTDAHTWGNVPQIEDKRRFSDYKGT